MNRWLGLGLILLIVGASILRWPLLDRRPMHNDEAVNAIKIQGLWEKGAYAYDPNEHHGPSLYYATLPFLWLSSARNFGDLDEATLRLPSAFFCLLLILSLWLVADAMGRGGSLLAGLFTAVSPAMVFYSAYFIHEMILVWATFLVLAAGWRYSQTRHVGWAAVAGIGIGLMHATKETFVINLFAFAVAGGATLGWARWREGEPISLRGLWNRKHLLAAVGAGAAVSLVLFTSFFTNWSGPLDSIRSYLPWLHRAGGDSPHIHPWHFYLERLAWFHLPKGPYWTEGLILLLGVVGGVRALSGRDTNRSGARFMQFVTFYTVVLTVVYSAIAYKTPWCFLGFLHGFILLAGYGAAFLLQLGRSWLPKTAIALALLVGVAHLTGEAWMAGTVYSADRKNPYVYAQTVANVLELARKVEAIAAVHPADRQMPVNVMAADHDYWPLPWYLRRLTQAEWSGGIPADPYSPVIVAGASLNAALDDKSDRRWLMVGMYELRPRTFLELYVELELWKKFLASQPRPTDDAD